MSHEELREKLLGLEGYTPELKSKYDREVHSMFEIQLPKWQRVAWSLSALLGLCFFIGFGIVVFTLPQGFPLMGRIGFMCGSLFGAVWAWLGYRIASKGKMDFKKHQGTASGLVWAMVVIMVTIDMLMASQMQDAARGNFMVLSGLVFLVMGVVFLLQYNIRQSEYSIRESLLRLEIQLADINERLNNTQANK